MERCIKVAKVSFLLLPTGVGSLQCSCPLKKMSRCFCESETNSANRTYLFIFIFCFAEEDKGQTPGD